MPVNPQSKTKIVVYIETSQFDILNALATTNGSAMSAVVRRILSKGLAASAA